MLNSATSTVACGLISLAVKFKRHQLKRKYSKGFCAFHASGLTNDRPSVPRMALTERDM